MPKFSLVISSLKDSLKDFVAGHAGEQEEQEEELVEYLHDGTQQANEDSDDEGGRGVAIASEEEVLAFASYLGIDAECHKDLLWVAEEALASPLPFGWKECVGEGGAVFFVQKDTNTVQWEHPLDAYYKSLSRKLIQEKESALKRLISIAEETQTASAPFFAAKQLTTQVAANQRREVLASISAPTANAIAAVDFNSSTQSAISKSDLADTETAAAAATVVAAQADEAAAVGDVVALEAAASEIDAQAAVYHHRSLASAAAYAADKVGDPKRDRRRKVLQFVQFLGMNAHEDQHLFWIAEEAANSSLPPHWEQLENDFGEEYFYNRRTNQCRTTHPLEDHYKKLYHKHKFPEAEATAASKQTAERASMLAKADALLPPALRAALNYTTAAPQYQANVGDDCGTSPAKSMMSLAAASRDGVAVYWGGYAVCGCIKNVVVSAVSGPDGALSLGVPAAPPSLFPLAAVASADATSSHMRIRVNVCSECPLLLAQFILIFSSALTICSHFLTNIFRQQQPRTLPLDIFCLVAPASIGCRKRSFLGDARCHSEVANTSSKSILHIAMHVSETLSRNRMLLLHVACYLLLQNFAALQTGTGGIRWLLIFVCLRLRAIPARAMRLSAISSRPKRHWTDRIKIVI